jgi:hypothetical protein
MRRLDRLSGCDPDYANREMPGIQQLAIHKPAQVPAGQVQFLNVILVD